MCKLYRFYWIGAFLAMFFHQVQAQEASGVSINDQTIAQSIITCQPDATESPNTIEPFNVQVKTEKI